MIQKIIEGSQPVVVFIGPATCGKSMVMMSLIDYLRQSPHNAIFEPVPGYLHCTESETTEAEKYAKTCKNFQDILSSNANTGQSKEKKALPGSEDQILVAVKQGRKTILRMLEAPGEDFFKPSEPDTPLKSSMVNILDKGRCGIYGEKPYPIYFVVLLDLHTRDNQFYNNDPLRGAYESRLIEILDEGYNANRGDRIILLYNKADLSTKTAEEVLNGFYPRLKAHLETRKLIFFKGTKYLGPIRYISGKRFTNHEVSESGGNTSTSQNSDPIQTYHHTTESKQSAEALWKLLNPVKSLF